MHRISKFDKALWTFFGIIALLMAGRILYTKSLHFVFLIWNLFLAWVPYLVSLFFSSVSLSSKKQGLALLFLWLLFVPNAFYIVTDFIHLRMHSNTPMWFDAVFLFACSFVGVVLGFVSLNRAMLLLEKLFTANIVRYILPPLLLVIGYGIYLGRFQRWNSWDIVHNPLALATSIADDIIFPFRNMRVWGISAVFALMVGAVYKLLKKLPTGNTRH